MLSGRTFKEVIKLPRNRTVTLESSEYALLAHCQLQETSNDKNVIGLFNNWVVFHKEINLLFPSISKHPISAPKVAVNSWSRKIAYMLIYITYL